MYLIVSLIRFKQSGVKRAGLLAALLMLSVSAYSASPEVAEKPANNLNQPDAQPQAEQASDAMRQGYRFPDWPQRLQITKKQIIPPPPPGPYMSSALSDYSVRAPSFGSDANNYEQQKPAYRHRMPAAPMDMFSPDIPWPENLRQAKHKHKHQAPNRWMPPDTGYQYVKPQSPQMPPVKGRSGNYSFGDNQGPGMNSSRWMPSMGMSPRGPYRVSPDYGQRYDQPAPYSRSRKLANPPYRHPGNPRYSDQGS